MIWASLPGSSNDGAQIAALQKQIQDLQKRPPPAPDTQAVDALRQRLSKIEHDIANLPPGDATIADRLTAADSAMKSLGIALAALNKRNDDSVANAKQAEERAAAAEGGERSARQRGERQAAGFRRGRCRAACRRAAAHRRARAGDEGRARAVAANATTDNAARLALSAAALRDAVERGAPYGEELAQAKALGAADGALGPLASFAAGGVPSQQALARALNDLMPALIKAAGVQDAPGGFLDRLQANASNLVRISPLYAPPGDTPSAVLARLEVAAAHSDIAAALNDIGKLPEAARQKAADWVSKATARQQAFAAARAFASDTARGLVSGSAK